MAKRLGRYCEICPSFKPHVHFDRFDEPAKVKKPARIGTSFMGDFYSEGIPAWVRASIYMRMEEAPWHTFIVLTKQPQNIDDYLPENLWVGVSVNRKEDLWRIDTLRYVDASVRAVSFEPLYEDLSHANLDGIGWVIIGSQTRPLVRPEGDWVHGLMEKAHSKNVAVFLKDNLGWNWREQEYPEKVSWK